MMLKRQLSPESDWSPDTMTSAKQNPGKLRKPGRPALPKGRAKQTIVPVRFSPGDRKRLAAVARANKTTVSGWIRTTLYEAMGI